MYPLAVVGTAGRHIVIYNLENQPQEVKVVYMYNENKILSYMSLSLSFSIFISVSLSLSVFLSLYFNLSFSLDA